MPDINAYIGNDQGYQGYIRQALQQVLNLIESCHAVEICRQEI